MILKKKNGPGKRVAFDKRVKKQINFKKSRKVLSIKLTENFKIKNLES